MATQVQQRRGNTTQSDAFTGAPGELTVNTSNNSVRVHDGSHLGGWELLRADFTNAQGGIPLAPAPGNTTEVQFNLGNVFTTRPEFTFDPASNLMTVTNMAVGTAVISNLNPDGDLVYGLGNATNRWANIFVGTVEATDANVTGVLTTAEANIANATIADANITNAHITTLTADNLVIANLAATALINGNSNVVVNPNADITFGANGVANVLIVNETGAVFLDVANVHIPGGTAGQQLSTDGAGNLTWVSPVTVLPLANGTSNVDIPAADGNITFGVNNNANFMVISDGHVLVNGDVTANGNVTAHNIELEAGGEITTPPGTNGDVVINPDGTGLFIVTAITPTEFGNSVKVLGEFIANANTVILGNVGNIHIDGGTAGQLLTTDGTGNLSWSTVTGGGGLSNGTSSGTIPVASGNINFSVGQTANAIVFTETGANFTGNLDVASNLTASYANVAGNVDAGNVNVVGNITAGNIDASGNINAFNVIADSLQSAVDFVATGNVDLGTVANVHIAGGTINQVLTTDGNSHLSWTTLPTGQGFANGSTSGSIPVAGGNLNITVGGIANTVVFASTQTDINTKLNVAGNANIAGEILGAGNANIALNANVGSNLSVGGWANIVGNVVAGNVVTAGDVTARNGIYSGNVTVTANLSANNGTFTNNVTAVNTTLTGTMKAATGNITGNLAVGGNSNITGSMNSTTANVTGLLTAGNVATDVVTANVANIAGNVNAVNGNFTNNVSAANGVFSANVTAVNSTLSGNIKAAAGNITGNLAVGANANIVGSMNSATANVTGNAIIGNVSTGIMESNVANIAGNLTSGNANLGNLATANFFSGDGSLLTNVMAKGQFTMNYSYTDPNPLNLLIVPAGSTVTLATVVVVTPFNDVTATISMGDTANANSLLATTDISAQINGTFTAQPALRYGADTQLVLGITPGTSTQGDGVLVINYV